MTQAALDRAVARATGESLREIRQRGFSVADPEEPDFDPEPFAPPQILDWDEVYPTEPVRFTPRRRQRIAA